MKTRTGNFPVGIRRGWTEWQADLPKLIEWAVSYEIGVIDVGNNPDDIAPVLQAGLRVGSIDLPDWHGLLSPDASKRAHTVAANSEYIAKCGPRNYFAVMLPEDPRLPRTLSLSNWKTVITLGA